jgi:hypothetical protein
MDQLIAAYNQTAHAFERKKQTVYQKHPNALYANLRNLILVRSKRRMNGHQG